MTCVVGIECDGGVMIGCDSWFGTSELSDRVDRPKWIIKGPVLVACAGDLRPLQLLDAAPSWRYCKPKENLGNYVSRVIAKAINDASGSVKYEATFLVAVHGQIHYIDETLMVMRSKYGYGAIGMAENNALSALAATDGIANSEERVLKVLKSVAKHHPRVAPDFHTIFHK